MVISRKQKPLLICQLVENPGVSNPGEALVTHTPLACLNEATQKKYALIMIHFSTRLVSSRDQLFQLCKCLKNNPLTGKTPILVSIEMEHRDIVLKMQQAGVRFMIVSPLIAPINYSQLINEVQREDALIGIDRMLEKLCPFLHYIPIDNQCELITCRAYGNRMVLGGKRLHAICKTNNHIHCEYHQNPRCKS